LKLDEASIQEGKKICQKEEEERIEINRLIKAQR
jgi:hypothetical protein